jgi:hypothetical protein
MEKDKSILIFGDSHSRAFKGISIPGYKIDLHAISSGSILGLPKLSSHLNISKTILETSKKTPPEFLILKLGQVDIENIFLYKKYISEKDSFKEKEFTDRVINSYETFIDTLKANKNIKHIAICGITPPAPKSTAKIVNHYYHSMVSKMTKAKAKSWNHIIKNPEFLKDLEYPNRISRSIKFNSMLKGLCKKQSIIYFEVFNDLLKDGIINKEFEGCNYHIKGTNHTEKNQPPYPKVKQLLQDALASIL